MDYIQKLPEPGALLRKHSHDRQVPEVNGHLHSPNSFCAFNSIEQMFQMALEEGVKVLGINDFYTADGYDEFALEGLRNRIFPLFNIEFIVFLIVFFSNKDTPTNLKLGVFQIA